MRERQARQVLRPGLALPLLPSRKMFAGPSMNLRPDLVGLLLGLVDVDLEHVAEVLRARLVAVLARLLAVVVEGLLRSSSSWLSSITYG